jgi:hypothetical protein
MARTYSDGIVAVAFKADPAAGVNGKLYYTARAASTADYVAIANGGSNPYPLGIIVDDSACNRGEAVPIKCFGFSKAVVAACCITGPASPLSIGDFLTSGSDGKLYAAGASGIACARTMEAVASGSAIVNVFFFGGITGCTAATS